MNFEQYLIESEIEELKKEMEDSDDYLKAPNGKKSNLPEKQWLMVRTKAFKNWFGDWENDPKNASKVVDKNGEPMIMYHVTDVDGIVEFKASWRGVMYFAKTLDGARKGTVRGDNVVYEVFLNCRNIKGKRAIHYSSIDSKAYREKVIKDGFDSINVQDEAKGTIAVFNSNQIKSIDNKGSFGKTNNINENEQ